MDGTGDEKEEEAETLDPQSCSSSNRASLALALAAIEQVWMIPAMRNPNPRTHDTRRRVKSKFYRTKNLMQSTPASDFG